MPSTAYMYAVYFARKPASALLVAVLLVLLFLGFNTLRSRKDLYTHQYVVDYIATHLDVKVTAGDTVPTALGVYIDLTNTGAEDILFGPWKIYFYTFGSLLSTEVEGFELGRINGGLHYMSPIEGKFREIPAGKTRHLVVKGYHSSTRTANFPNWYVASETYGLTSPRIIKSTKDESLSFVGDFVSPVQWKKHEFDLYNPYTPSERYKLYREYDSVTEGYSKDNLDIIPKPLSVKTTSRNVVNVDKTWVIVNKIDSENLSAVKLLAQKLGLKKMSTLPNNGNYIAFETDRSFEKEQYEVKVKSDMNFKAVFIISNSDAGAFYGVQTLLSMHETSNSIPEVIIKDKPRFSYRGLMLDVARNFHKKETVMKIIDVMAMYKMNKLHFHLTDDEGWRIEIPSIPELTKYGSRRCHHFEEEKCLIPSLGSGPFPSSSGSGFYSVSDFREILRYAKERFVQVIPEIDIPGHALSSIQSMLFREKDLKQQQTVGKPVSYVLSDDVSGIPSIQSWLGNSMNPCVNASYRFVDTVLVDLKMIYEGIQTLDLVHIGGDEVPEGVWEHSAACRAVFHGNSLDHNTIKKMFVFTVADIAHRRGLNVSAWEDGVYNKGDGPFKVKDFKQKEVYVNAWNNVWGGGRGGRAIEYADGGYKVILSLATHLYFDHPYEPDPDERGLVWATRYIDTYKVFGYMPMDVFANADYDSFGNKINLDELCGGPCPEIRRPENIFGMEACVWSETIRNETQMFDMIFPRLLALAERSWHQADWERIGDTESRTDAKGSDFKRFINILGRKELSRIEKAGVSYRVPPPGIQVSEDNKSAKINTFYPNHDIMISYDNGSSWKKTNNAVTIPNGVKDIHVYALSPVLKRKSRTIALRVTNTGDSIHSFSTFKLVLLSISLCILKT